MLGRRIMFLLERQKQRHRHSHSPLARFSGCSDSAVEVRRRQRKQRWATGGNTRWFNEGSGVTLSQVPQPVGLHIGLHRKDRGAAAQKTCPSGRGMGFALIRSRKKIIIKQHQTHTHPQAKHLSGEMGLVHMGLALVNLLVK